MTVQHKAVSAERFKNDIGGNSPKKPMQRPQAGDNTSFKEGPTPKAR